MDTVFGLVPFAHEMRTRSLPLRGCRAITEKPESYSMCHSMDVQPIFSPKMWSENTRSLAAAMPLNKARAACAHFNDTIMAEGTLHDRAERAESNTHRCRVDEAGAAGLPVAVAGSLEGHPSVRQEHLHQRDGDALTRDHQLHITERVALQGDAEEGFTPERRLRRQAVCAHMKHSEYAARQTCLCLPWRESVARTGDLMTLPPHGTPNWLLQISLDAGIGLL